MTDNNTGRSGDGFELDGEFYRWHLSDIGKDLMLIDRISGMSVAEFYELAQDPVAQERIPVLLTLIATSIRHRHHDWSVERIYRRVMDLSISKDVTMIDGDSEEDSRPLLSAAPATPPSGEPERSPSGEPERSPNIDSSPPSTPAANGTSQTSYATLP
jgi:hypothetical protein